MHTISILENLSKTFNEDQAKSIVKALEEFEEEKQHVTREHLEAALQLQTAEVNASIKKLETDLTESMKKMELEFTTSHKNLGLEFTTSHKNLELDFATSHKNLEIRLIKWVIGLMIAQTSITIAIIKMIG